MGKLDRELKIGYYSITAQRGQASNTTSASRDSNTQVEQPTRQTVETPNPTPIPPDDTPVEQMPTDETQTGTSPMPGGGGGGGGSSNQDKKPLSFLKKHKKELIVAGVVIGLIAGLKFIVK